MATFKINGDKNMMREVKIMTGCQIDITNDVIAVLEGEYGLRFERLSPDDAWNTGYDYIIDIEEYEFMFEKFIAAVNENASWNLVEELEADGKVTVDYTGCRR